MKFIPQEGTCCASLGHMGEHLGQSGTAAKKEVWLTASAVGWGRQALKYRVAGLGNRGGGYRGDLLSVSWAWEVWLGVSQVKEVLGDLGFGQVRLPVKDGVTGGSV